MLLLPILPAAVHLTGIVVDAEEAEGIYAEMPVNVDAEGRIRRYT